jgi:hypothetical protein
LNSYFIQKLQLTSSKENIVPEGVEANSIVEPKIAESSKNFEKKEDFMLKILREQMQAKQSQEYEPSSRPKLVLKPSNSANKQNHVDYLRVALDKFNRLREQERKKK